MADFKDTRIRTKLIIIQALTALTAVAICSVIFVLNSISSFKESAIQNRYSIAEVVGANAASALVFKDQESAKKLLANLSGNESILNAALIDKDGHVFADYNLKGEKPYLFTIAPQTQRLAYFNKEDGKFVISFLIIEDNELLGTLFIRSEYSALKEIVNKDIKAAIWISLMALAAATIISLFLQNIISGRLQLLVNKTKEVTTTGNYSTRVEEESSDEIGTLAREFNNMLEQIQKRDDELEQRVMERTAELEASNKELESFSYSVSHDMRAPVRAVTGFSNILAAGYSSVLDEDGRDALRMIDTEAKRMGQLIDDLLAFSRLGKKEIKKAPVDMNELVKHAIEEVLKSSEEKGKTNITVDDLPPCRCDYNLILQVFINLISNAVKYSQFKEAPNVHIGALTASVPDETVYYIEDNGVGFDMEYYNKLFGVFQRLHTDEQFKGTGIGLAIVQKIILRHGGRVWAESKVNDGATFYFSIPR